MMSNLTNLPPGAIELPDGIVLPTGEMIPKASFFRKTESRFVHLIDQIAKSKPGVHSKFYIDGKKATFADIPDTLPNEIKSKLENSGIKKLYAHQRHSYDSLYQSNKDLFLMLPTAGGKSLSFLLPILSELSKDKNKTALFLFPTKALANDQIATMKKYTQINIEILTGDTSSKHKRENTFVHGTVPQIVVATPEAINMALPREEWSLFQLFVSNLCFTVLDEAHLMDGAFGGNIIELFNRIRIKKIKSYSGTPMRLILASATCGNPDQLMATCSDNYTMLTESSASSADKEFVIMNPGSGYKRSVIKLTQLVLKYGFKTIVFMNSIAAIKALETELKDRLGADYEQVDSYYSSIHHQEKLDIEQRFRAGKINVLLATAALEVGVDISGVDCVVLTGSGTTGSFLQRIGRCGRGDQSGLVIYVPSEHSILDKFTCEHFEAIHYQDGAEPVITNHGYPTTVATSMLASMIESDGLTKELIERFWGDMGIRILSNMLNTRNQKYSNGMVVQYGNEYYAHPSWGRTPHVQIASRFRGSRTENRATYGLYVDGYLDESNISTDRLIRDFAPKSLYHSRNNGIVEITNINHKYNRIYGRPVQDSDEKKGVNPVVKTHVNLGSSLAKEPILLQGLGKPQLDLVNLTIVDSLFGVNPILSTRIEYVCEKHGCPNKMKPMLKPKCGGCGNVHTYRKEVIDEGDIIKLSPNEQIANRLNTVGLVLTPGASVSPKYYMQWNTIWNLFKKAFISMHIGQFSPSSVNIYFDMATKSVILYDDQSSGNGCTRNIYEILRHESHKFFSKLMSIVQLCECDAGCHKCLYGKHTNMYTDYDGAMVLLKSLTTKTLGAKDHE